MIARQTTSALELEDLLLVFDLAPVGLCIARDRVIRRCNEFFARMFGYRSAELEGCSLLQLYPSPEEFEHIGQLGLPVLKQTGSYTDDRIMRRRDGQLFWCHVAGRSLSKEDPFACAVWAFQDLSRERPVSVALTAREREIAQQLVAGRTSKQIARSLEISHRTVEAHRGRLMRKLDVTSVAGVVARLVGLASEDPRPPRSRDVE